MLPRNGPSLPCDLHYVKEPPRYPGVSFMEQNALLLSSSHLGELNFGGLRSMSKTQGGLDVFFFFFVD